MAQLKDLIVNGFAKILGKVYASEFVGKLTGNASTATKATQDASGNVITSTYATKTEVTPVNNLLATTAGKPLDAVQGALLKEIIGTSNIDDIVYTKTYIDAGKLKATDRYSGSLLNAIQDVSVNLLTITQQLEGCIGSFDLNSSIYELIDPNNISDGIQERFCSCILYDFVDYAGATSRVQKVLIDAIGLNSFIDNELYFFYNSINLTKNGIFYNVTVEEQTSSNIFESLRIISGDLIGAVECLQNQINGIQEHIENIELRLQNNNI